MSTPVQPLTLLLVAVASWLQRDQQAAIVYLLEENRVLKARLGGRKLRLAEVAGIVTPACNVASGSSFAQDGEDFLVQ